MKNTALHLFFATGLGVVSLSSLAAGVTGVTCPIDSAKSSINIFSPDMNIAPSDITENNSKRYLFNDAVGQYGIRLTLPVNSNDCGFYNKTSDTFCPPKNAIGAGTISSLLLSSGYSFYPYFYANADKNIVLRAPANGATTTPGCGSDHVRTEMIEGYDGPDSDQKGNWKYNTGGKLTGDVQINQVVKGEKVIFAQLHAAGAPPFVGVYYYPDPDGRVERNRIGIMVFDSPNYYDENNQLVTPTVKNYFARTSALNVNDKTGQPFFHYELSYGPKFGNTIDLKINGISISQTAIEFNEIWKDVFVRFSLGAYQTTDNQNLDSIKYADQATIYTQVTYKNFKIEHGSSL